MIRLFCGFDPREAAAYHVFAQSVIERSTVPVALIPLHLGMLSGFDGRRDGSNDFGFSRYLIPSLCQFSGWAIFCDGDMLCREDLAELWKLRDERFAIQVVKHEYKTKHPYKYTGTPMVSSNVDYPRKNQSSVMLWFCGHPANAVLTREFVTDSGASFLHRFEWLKEEQIGGLPIKWNHLVREYPLEPAAIAHFTLGVPGFPHYRDDDYAQEWAQTYLRAVNLMGENPLSVTRRALEDSDNG